MSRASFQQAIFLSSRLSGPGPQPASLRDADLRGAVLIDVDLRHADLSGARFEGALLCGADLRGARVDGATWDGASLIHVRSVEGGEGGGVGGGAQQARVPVGDRIEVPGSTALPGWASEPADALVWQHLQRAPGELAVRLAVELARRGRMAPAAHEERATFSSREVAGEELPDVAPSRPTPVRWQVGPGQR